jgi:hypothetical protein
MRIAEGYASAAAANLRTAAASPDSWARSRAIEEALAELRSAGEYFWGRPAEQCDHIAACLEASADASAAVGLRCYAEVLEGLCSDRVRAFV